MHVAVGKDELDPLAGVIYRTWRDEPFTNGES